MTNEQIELWSIKTDLSIAQDEVDLAKQKFMKAEFDLNEATTKFLTAYGNWVKAGRP